MLYQGIHLFNLKYLLDELVILVCLKQSISKITVWDKVGFSRKVVWAIGPFFAFLLGARPLFYFISNIKF